MNAHRNDSRFVSAICDRAIEVLLLACVAIAPWAYGCTDATYEFVLTLAISATFLLFAVSAMAGERPVWHGGRLATGVCLGWVGLAAVAASHLVTLPSGTLGSLSPGVSAWTDPLTPGQLEPVAWPDRSTLAAVSSWAAGDRLGLYAGGSFQTLVRLALLIGLLVVVTCLRHPRQTLTRLSWVGTVTGTALAIFGIAQHYGSHDGLVYWVREVEGGLGFGPFINRNHYPFFINLSLGLSIGLLFSRLGQLGRQWYRMLLHDPAITWILTAITFMVASLIVCGSRGGILSIMAAVSIVGILRLRAANAARGVFMTAAVAFPTVILLTWVGFQFQESRLTMLTESDRYTTDGRIHLWRSALSSVPEFPWFGSGGETFRHWDTIHQSGDPQWNNWKSYSLRADNEWLDVLNEYGLIGFCALLLLTLLVIRAAVRICRTDPWGAGAAIGVLAVALHSFVDFGLRVPATGTYAIVVTALMLVVDRRSSRPTEKSVTSDTVAPFDWPPIKRGGWVVASGLLVLIAMGGIATQRRYFHAERLEDRAMKSFEEEQYEDVVDKMAAAVRVVPEDLQTRLRLIRMTQRCMNQTPDRSPASWRELVMRHSVIATRLCPLAWQPYAWLAQYSVPDRSIVADRRTVLLMRARSLHRSEPDMAYLAGKFALERGQTDQAIRDWRDSLTYSTGHLQQILGVSTSIWEPDRMVNELLPADPVVLLEAANFFKDEGALREPLLGRAADALAQLERTPRDLLFGGTEELKSRILLAQGRPKEAIAMLSRAISVSPERLQWRLQLVQWLIQEKRWDEATREVRIVLAYDRQNAMAKRYQAEVVAGKSGSSR